MKYIVIAIVSFFVGFWTYPKYKIWNDERLFRKQMLEDGQRAKEEIDALIEVMKEHPELFPDYGLRGAK